MNLIISLSTDTRTGIISVHREGKEGKYPLTCPFRSPIPVPKNGLNGIELQIIGSSCDSTCPFFNVYEAYPEKFIFDPKCTKQ